MNYPSPTISTAPPAAQTKAVKDGLLGCDGWSSLWFKSCCQQFACADNAAPQGSNKCQQARIEGWCFKLTELEGA